MLALKYTWMKEKVMQTHLQPHIFFRDKEHLVFICDLLSTTKIAFNLFDKEFSWYGGMNIGKLFSVLKFFKLV